LFKRIAEFDKLLRLVQRQTNVAERVPGVFLKTLQVLETAANATSTKEKEAKKKMNQANAKALNAVKKKVKGSQKEYEGPLKQYQEVYNYDHCCVKMFRVFERTLKHTIV
jgi:translation initiation factor 3 subunit C